MRIRYCERCDRYTMMEICLCGSKTSLAIPPKYSPDDKYKHLKRQLRWNL
jgi:H/ACA ribonucleoprotein complex subunit 3